MHYLMRIIITISFLMVTSYTLAEEAKTSDGKQKAPEISKLKGNIDSTSQNKDDSDSNIAYANPLVYDLPNPGAPDTSRLIGAGTRTKGQNIPYLSVLTPKHTGLTLSNQPILYWFTSEPITMPLEFVLVSEQSYTPVLKVPLSQPQHAGVQSIKLSDYNVILKPETVYQWSIALIPNIEMRTHDIVTSGKIKRIKPVESLQRELLQTPEISKPSIYAKRGIWYDLMNSLADSIAKRPADHLFKESRAQLLEQVGLIEVAHYERK
ncbi:MAG: DUF928 domain-containing protein [Methylococcales bacterium]